MENLSHGGNWESGINRILAIQLTGKHISDTVLHTTTPNKHVLTYALSELKKINLDRYNFVSESGIIIDVGGGDSIPLDISKHGIKFYLSIDLNRSDREYERDGCKMVTKRGDIFEFLEKVPDGSIPCFFISALDGYILNGEGKKLSELLNKKCLPSGVILVRDSDIMGEKVVRIY